MKKTISMALGLLAAATGLASTTMDPAHKQAYGANVGWINAAGDVTHGAVIGQAVCSGYLYGANVGWIHLGDGSPVDGQAYGNASATDYGVNHDGLGQLTGYAYGANIGWINFEQTHGQPRVDLLTGVLSGSVWGSNVGWISLSNALAFARTETLNPGPDSDADGIPDHWEYAHFGQLAKLSKDGADLDGDGASDVDEYFAGTDPGDATDVLVITDFQINGTTHAVTWPAKPNRLYTLQYTTALSNGTSWVTAAAPFVPASGAAVTKPVSGMGDAVRFYRVQAAPPLYP